MHMTIMVSPGTIYNECLSRSLEHVFSVREKLYLYMNIRSTGRNFDRLSSTLEQTFLLQPL